jgi:hypothetical protein
VDNVVYGRGANPLLKHDTTVRWAKHYVGPSFGKRVAEIPSYALASIVPGFPRKIRNEIAERHHNRHPFAYSFESQKINWTSVALLWLATLAALWASRPISFHSALFAACLAVFTCTILLHSFWGTEIFLYSQHWLAFLCFAIARAIDTQTTGRKSLISGAVLVVVTWNLFVVAKVLNDLSN